VQPGRGTLVVVRGRANDLTIQRERLIAVVATTPVVLLEAPGGYGKSLLAAQLAASLDLATARVIVDIELGVAPGLAHALRRSGLADLVDAIDESDPQLLVGALAARPGGVLITIDEVHRASGSAVTWLCAVANDLPPHCRLVLAGRRLGRELAGLAGNPGVALLGAIELRFDGEETKRSLTAAGVSDPTGAAVEAVWRLTGGWPAAVALAAARLVTSGVGTGGAISDAVGAGTLADLVDRQLATVDAATATLARDLAHLPLLSAEVAAEVGGPGSLDRVLELGLPIQFRRDGWGEMSDPIREHLTAGHRPPRDVLRAAAEVYARRGELPVGGLLLARHEDFDGLIEMLARCTRTQLAQLGPATLGLLLDVIPDAVIVDHASVLVLAALAIDELDSPRRIGWLDRARRLGGADDGGRRALEVELGWEQVRRHELDEAIATLQTALDGCEPGEYLTLGRANMGLGLARLIREQGRASDRSIADLESAIALFRIAGEPTLEAQALRACAFGAHFNLGAFDVAAQQLERAAALLAAPDARRSLFLTFVAEVDRDLGRLETAESALHEALAIARRTANGRAIGYAAWSFALLAGERRDRGGLDRWRAEAVAHSASFIELGAGVDFYGMFAEVLLQVGDVDIGLDYVTKAENHPAAGGYVWPPRSARARYETMYGDPVAAEAVLDELDAIGPHRERPLRGLMRAVCALRRGDASRSHDEFAAAERAAAELGDRQRLQRREPELIQMLAIELPSVKHVIVIRMLGDFVVTAAGAILTPPSGRAATLVKVLALRGALSVDAAIDLLWEDCDLDTGRARLRNLLNRIKTSSDGLVERDGELLRLASNVDIDVTRFERAVMVALEADASTRVGAARTALSMFGGQLLPGDGYADWALGPRERLQRRYLAIVDLVASDAIDRGDLDEAIGLLDIGIEAEPFELWRFESVARALVTLGRSRAAVDVATRAEAVATSLGETLDASLASLLEVRGR
jgi:DNA-binding SARP family transcriptional activator